MNKISKILPGMFLVLMLLVSCGETATKTTNSSTLGKGPLPDKTVKGSVMNLALDSTVDTLDSGIAVYATSFEVIGDAVDGLKQMGSDGTIKNAICKEQTVSDDGLIYTFKLREDAYWSNGEHVTANDFIYAWQRAVAPETESEYAFLISEIAQIKNGLAIQAGAMEKDQLGVRALDDFTLQVELEVPVSYFDQLLYFATFYPINQKFHESVGDKYGTSPETFLCNGAFILTKYAPETHEIELIKNTTYYNADTIKLGGLHYDVFEDTGAGLAKYKKGELDVVEISSEQIPEYKDSSELKVVDTGFLFYISLNMDKPNLSNRNLRRALTMAFDRQVVCDYLADGSKPSWTAVPAGYTFDSKGVDFSKTGVEFPEYCSYNPEKAREYLKLAKQELKKDRIEIEFMSSSVEEQQKCAELIAGEIEKNLPGVKVTLRIVDRKDRRKLMSKGDYEIGLTNWGPDYTDPMTYLSMWMTGNDNNTGNYSNPKYDAILAQCTNGDLCTKIDQRWKALKEAEEIVMSDVVVMPVYTQCSVDLIKPNVKGISFHAVGINKIYKLATK